MGRNILDGIIGARAGKRAFNKKAKSSLLQDFGFNLLLNETIWNFFCHIYKVRTDSSVNEADAITTDWMDSNENLSERL
jgi:hypothetical protein